MKLAIVGSRSFNNYTLLKNYINSLNLPITLIVSGGASGADSLGEKYCLEYELEKLIFYPDWKKFGRQAGFIRNKDIIENADVVVAFWDGVSKGTKNSIDLAKKMNKELYIVNELEDDRINELIKEF